MHIIQANSDFKAFVTTERQDCIFIIIIDFNNDTNQEYQNEQDKPYLFSKWKINVSLLFTVHVFFYMILDIYSYYFGISEISVKNYVLIYCLFFRKRLGPRYITLDDYGNYTGSRNPSYEPEL